MLAELLAGLVARGAAEAASGLSYAARQDAALAGLPPPMQPGYQLDDASLCAMGEAFRAAAVAWRGFEYRAQKPDAPTPAQQKWGWAGLRAGAAGRTAAAHAP